MTAARLFTTLATSALVAGCATVSTAADAISLRIVEANQSAPADAPYLFLKGEIVNASTKPMRGGGCERPDIAIDSLGTHGWMPMEVNQSAELIICIRAFTVEPGQTAVFQTAFQSRGGWFPTGKRLRLRVLRQGDAPGPTREFTL